MQAFLFSQIRFPSHSKASEFFRNNEYFNPFREGYTLTGSHLRPLLVWNPVSSVEIKGGLFLSLWSGYDPGIRQTTFFGWPALTIQQT
jgi:hypothetical protein